MRNGHRFNGEIKARPYGEQIVKSDYLKGSLYLDWRQVEILQSKDTFIVELSNEERVTRFIEKINTGGDGSDLTIIAKVHPSHASEPRLRSCHVRHESRSRDEASFRKPRSFLASRLTERKIL